MNNAYNTCLAANLRLINDIRNVCKEFGVETCKIAKEMGLDNLISEQFLRGIWADAVAASEGHRSHPRSRSPPWLRAADA